MNPYTYSLLPEANRSALCSHYGTQEQRDNWNAVEGYLVVDCGQDCDMAVDHPNIKSACDAHSYSSEIEDVVKVPVAEAQAKEKAHIDASSFMGDYPVDGTELEQEEWRVDYQEAYDTAYDSHYPTELASVVIDYSSLNQEQAIAYAQAFLPEVEEI